MPKLVLKSDVAVTPDRLWHALRDFGGLDRWNPLAHLLECDGDHVGSTRRVELPGTGVFVERLDGRDDGERAYRYTIIESPLAISNAMVELRVRDRGDGKATVEWTGSFDSEAPSEFQAVRTFQELYQGALDNLAGALDSKTRKP